MWEEGKVKLPRYGGVGRESGGREDQAIITAVVRGTCQREHEYLMHTTDIDKVHIYSLTGTRYHY